MVELQPLIQTIQILGGIVMLYLFLIGFGVALLLSVGILSLGGAWFFHAPFIERESGIRFFPQRIPEIQGSLEQERTSYPFDFVVISTPKTLKRLTPIRELFLVAIDQKTGKAYSYSEKRSSWYTLLPYHSIPDYRSRWCHTSPDKWRISAQHVNEIA